MLPGSSLFGFQGGANEEAAEYALKNDKPVKVNAWQRLFGATDEDANNVLLRRQQKDLNRQYGAQMAAIGLTGADWGEDEQAVLAKIAQRTEERAIGQRNRTESIESKRSADERASLKELKQMDITANAESEGRRLEADNNRFAFQTKIEGMRNAHTASEAQKDRALERTLSNNSNDLQMQMAFMNAELADKRMEYDRETQRLDRRDRHIANLMKSLGTLGGAFAL